MSAGGRGRRHLAARGPPCTLPSTPPVHPPARTGDCSRASSAAAEYARAGAPRTRSRAPRPGLAKPEVAWGARRPRSRWLYAADTRWVRGACGGRWWRTGTEGPARGAPRGRGGGVLSQRGAAAPGAPQPRARPGWALAAARAPALPWPELTRRSYPWSSCHRRQFLDGLAFPRVDSPEDTGTRRF